MCSKTSRGSPFSSEMAEMYAVVDLSKKKRHVEKTSYNEAKAVVEAPLYTPIDKSKRTLENSEDYTKLSSSRLGTGPQPSQGANNTKRFSVKIIILPIIAAVACFLCISFIIMFAVIFVKISALEAMDTKSLETNTATTTSSINQISTEIAPHYPSSCADVVEDNVTKLSGYYILRSATGDLVNVYCDTTRRCNGVSGGWMRVAKLDVNSCPQTLMPKTYRKMFHTCIAKEDAGGCTSIFYHNFNIPYSQVCGQVRGYQVGMPDGLRGERVTMDINSNYLDGISITVNRRHVWSFIAGNCVGLNTTLPTTLMNNWTCEETNTCPPGVLCTPLLWNTQQWNMATSWFRNGLQESTTADIEVRICRDQDRSNKDVAVNTLELYVQ